MDVDIVNRILGLCIEQETCLFELTKLFDDHREQKLTNNIKYILASVKNYSNIFKISRDQTRIEFFMPFEICRNSIGSSSNEIRLCYDYFYTNSCRRALRCPHPHHLNQTDHQLILGILNNLNLKLLTRAFHIYCQSKKHMLIHHSAWSQPLLSSTEINTRVVNIPQLNRETSWKKKTCLERTVPIVEKALQICWTPTSKIDEYFIEILFSNEKKSNGGPLRSQKVYQHLGVAHVFYKNADLVDRVLHRGTLTFQSFLLTTRLLQRTADQHRVCLRNLSFDSNKIADYIEKISGSYSVARWTFYQDDPNIVIVDYNEQINFSKIFFNVRNHPTCNETMVDCQILYLPETLLIEYEQNYSHDQIKSLFNNENIFSIKIYPQCAFLHFYSHQDLLQTVQNMSPSSIRMTPIHVDLYSNDHLEIFLHKRSIENSMVKEQSRTLIESSDNSINCKQSDIIPEFSNEIEENQEQIDSDSDTSGDDLHDLPSEFEDDDAILDEAWENNGDLEFIRSAAKNLMSSLNDTDSTASDAEFDDNPHSLLYGDDYSITIKNRRFVLAFLDYTQFRVEKQSSSDRFRLLTSLKKKKEETPSSRQINKKKTLKK